MLPSDLKTLGALVSAKHTQSDWHFDSGLNLKTGQRGIFPEAHIVEIDLVEEICRSVLPDMNRKLNVV